MAYSEAPARGTIAARTCAVSGPIAHESAAPDPGQHRHQFALRLPRTHAVGEVAGTRKRRHDASRAATCARFEIDDVADDTEAITKVLRHKRHEHGHKVCDGERHGGGEAIAFGVGVELGVDRRSVRDCAQVPNAILENPLHRGCHWNGAAPKPTVKSATVL